MNDIQVFDNFIPIEDQNNIESNLLGYDFPWYYNKNISYQNEEFNKKWLENDVRLKDTDGFLHSFLKDGNTSIYFDVIKPIIYQLKIKELLRIRGVLVNKNSSFGNFINIPHVDFPIEHLTAIYYVNDSDGDTVLFKEFWKESVDVNKKTIAQRISPKKGRLLLFNGLRYHSGSVPSSNHRLVININFIKNH